MYFPSFPEAPTMQTLMMCAKLRELRFGPQRELLLLRSDSEDEILLLGDAPVFKECWPRPRALVRRLNGHSTSL